MLVIVGNSIWRGALPYYEFLSCWLIRILMLVIHFYEAYMILGMLASWGDKCIQVALRIEVVVFGIFFDGRFMHKGRLRGQYLWYGRQNINCRLFLNWPFLIRHYKLKFFRLADICFLMLHRMIFRIRLLKVSSCITLLFCNFKFDFRVHFIYWIFDAIRYSFQGFNLK